MPGPGCALCAEPPALGAGQSEPLGHVGAEPSHPPVPAVPICGGGDTSGQAALGAQQGKYRLFLVPVLGFLPSSICISLITLLFGHLGLIPVTVLGLPVSLASLNAQKSEH